MLFMDIVGYSRLAISDQTRSVYRLQELVRATRAYTSAQAAGELIGLPTGDGMALVFFGDPEAPVTCAIELASALRAEARLPLRMGIHHGPVTRTVSIDANANVLGTGINLAQRVMACGDDGHILLSSTYAELLREIGTWEPHLHDLGLQTIKHDESLRIYNYYDGRVGNAAVPERVVRFWGEIGGRPLELRVVLLYRRQAQPDEQVLALLEQALTKRGVGVFIDRHLKIGVEWAKEIERQLRSADAVIPLLSSASVRSEMLAYELQTADEARQATGKPRILPVRLAYSEPLPEPIASILDPLQFHLWSAPGDNPALVECLVAALRNPVEPEAPRGLAAERHLPPESLESIGGAVPLHSPFYVERDVDADLIAAVARSDSIVLLKGARQMGKTSLLSRGIQAARKAGSAIAITDLQKLNQEQLIDLQTLFLALGTLIAEQLDLEVTPEQTWRPGRAPNLNFERYLRREVIGAVGRPLVWALDEVDRLFTCTYGSEFFGLLRSWHNERSLDPTGPWSNLTVVIAYATEASLFISDVNQSPFNVGTRIELQDFGVRQVADLNERYGSPLRSESELDRFYDLVGGHPYLVRRGLHEMVRLGLNLATFETVATRPDGPYGDHLRRILILLCRDDEMTAAVRTALVGSGATSPAIFYRLRAAGLVSGVRASEMRPRCQVYQRYLSEHLL